MKSWLLWFMLIAARASARRDFIDADDFEGIILPSPSPSPSPLLQVLCEWYEICPFKSQTVFTREAA